MLFYMQLTHRYLDSLAGFWDRTIVEFGISRWNCSAAFKLGSNGLLSAKASSFLIDIVRCLPWNRVFFFFFFRLIMRVCRSRHYNENTNKPRGNDTRTTKATLKKCQPQKDSSKNQKTFLKPLQNRTANTPIFIGRDNLQKPLKENQL